MSETDYMPYRQLWASVILQTIRDMSSKVEERYVPAVQYMAEINDEPGGLDWICDILDLCADRMRAMCSTPEGRLMLVEKKRALDRVVAFEAAFE